MCPFLVLLFSIQNFFFFSNKITTTFYVYLYLTTDFPKVGFFIIGSFLYFYDHKDKTHPAPTQLYCHGAMYLFTRIIFLGYLRFERNADVVVLHFAATLLLMVATVQLFFGSRTACRLCFF